jgi:16S rRNA (adenine(1408)-N(1))-methyltransferase
MRLLQGSKIVESPPDWREAIERDGRPVVIDLGSGDGRYAYESARSDPKSLCMAVDPDAAALAEYAYRAGRKSARGGVTNVIFVVASVEQLPRELDGLAERVRINFPWGSLLRALLAPEPPLLGSIARILRPGGSFEIVLSYDPGHDTGAFAGGPLPALDQVHIETKLIPAYGAAGLPISHGQRLDLDEALAIPSSWGRRLLHTRPREVFLIAGTMPRAA